MNRVEFLRNSLIASGSLMAGTVLGADTATRGDLAAAQKGKTFNLDYAPHEGMFSNSAGKSFLDQIQFMYDQGFRSIEDNGYLDRPVEEQTKIGNLLAKLGMRMGVFVVDGGDNWKISLTTGKKEFKDKFVATCKRAVESAMGFRWPTLSIPCGQVQQSLNRKD
jgi:hydroxypyruvate isomerase